MMQIFYLKENSVDLLKKSDLHINSKFYYDKDSTWIDKKYINHNLFLPFNISEVNDFVLKTENGVKDDYDNMVIMYENLKFLTDSQASDERLWAGMAHTIFWDYMQKRWSTPKNKDDLNSHILNNYFFWNSTKAPFLNGLSRLWWYARFTYDEELDDHYELTRYICNNDINGKIFPLLSCVFANNKDVFKNIIKAVKKYEEDNNIKLSREQFGMLKTYLYRLSGKILIDQLSSEDLYKIISERIIFIQKSNVWKNDIKNIIKKISENEFSIEDIYSYEAELKKNHPENNHIRDKIRQQLQILRDEGYVEFLGNGKYKKINASLKN